MLDTVQEVRAGRRTGGGAPGAGPATTVLPVRNAGASALPEYGVCTVTGTAVPVGPGFRAAPLLEVDAPAAGAAVLVTLEPIPPGHAGRAVAAGAACVQIDVTDAAHERAAPVAGESGHLASAADGPVVVLWRESGTGVKWAWVLLGGTAPAVAPGTTAFVTVDVDDGENAPYFSGQVTEYQESGYLAGTWQLTTPVWIVGRSATAGDPGSYTTPVYTQRYLAVIGPDHTIDGDTRPRAWIEDQHGPYYRGGIRPNGGATPGDMLHGSYNVEWVLQAAEMVTRTNWTGATPVVAQFVARHDAEDGVSYSYHAGFSWAHGNWTRRYTEGGRVNRLTFGFTHININTVDQEHFFTVVASYYDPEIDDNVYCKAGYAAVDENEMEWYGVWGTMADGSVVSGGLITSIGSGGSGDMDYGTW